MIKKIIKKIIKRIKGFTLAELLITIIILAILAAIVVPGFVAQIEIAKIAEAQHVLGAMAHAELTMNELTQSSWIVPVDSDPAFPNEYANWIKIGMQPPALTNFRYRCDLSGYCEAERQPSPNPSGIYNVIQLGVLAGNSQGIPPREFRCGPANGAYELRNPSDPTKGCTLG